MKKPALTIEARPVSEKHESDESSGDATEHQPNWEPGYAEQFPFIGFAAVLTLVLSAVGCALVLIMSNDKSSSQWSSVLRPNVAVSILSVVGNVALVTALSQGIPVAWWVKAVHGTTISQLHESWRCSTGVLALAQNLFRLDVIGIAVLVAKISVLDSIFYQRATTTYVGQDSPQVVAMLGAAATAFPSTGYVVAEGFSAQKQCNCFMIGDEYTPVVNTWTTSNGFFQGFNRYFQQCDGVCYASIEAIGFEIDCDTSITQTNLAAAPIQAYDAAGGATKDSAAWTGIPIFNSSFAMAYPTGNDSNQTVIDLDLHYFQSADPYQPSGTTCHGAVTNIQCKLWPALVRYPITITNFTNPHVTNGVSLGSIPASSTTPNPSIPPYSKALKQAEGFKVMSYLYPNETGKLDSISYLGGLANALHLALSSTATISYQGQGAWALSQAGVLAQTMMYGPPNMGSCDCSFRDESLSTIIASINQLAYLTSTGMIDQQAVQLPATTASSSKVLAPSASPITNVNTTTPLLIRGVASNSTTFFRPLQGTLQISDVDYYKTHFIFVGLGLGLTLLCAATTAALFWRYGTLGREVTMGPIEIAGAFGAPMLCANVTNKIPHEATARLGSSITPVSSMTTEGPSNDSPSIPPTSPGGVAHPPLSPVTFSNLDDLLATVGDRRVLYGFVDVDDDDDPGAVGANDTALRPPLSPALSEGSGRQRRSQFLAFGSAADGAVKRTTSMAV